MEQCVHLNNECGQAHTALPLTQLLVDYFFVEIGFAGHFHDLKCTVEKHFVFT